MRLTKAIYPQNVKSMLAFRNNPAVEDGMLWNNVWASVQNENAGVELWTAPITDL